MILTVAVLMYQLLFVVVLYIASRFGRMALNVVLILCLLWTVVHVFFLPLAVLQGTVVLGSYLLFRRRYHQPGAADKAT